jgi:hypothetical protein
VGPPPNQTIFIQIGRGAVKTPRRVLPSSLRLFYFYYTPIFSICQVFYIRIRLENSNLILMLYSYKLLTFGKKIVIIRA